MRQNSVRGEAGGACTAVLGSMTQAMRAQAILGEAAIRVPVVKISSGRTRGGCAYGIDFPCVQERHVRALLERHGVRVREWVGAAYDLP